MIKHRNDINDNEIRIISPDRSKENGKRRPLRWILASVLTIVILGGICVFFVLNNDETEKDLSIEAPKTNQENPTLIKVGETFKVAKSFVSVLDTVVNKQGLLILSPHNARPRLVVGAECLTDSNILLATQAADIRGDNGQIVGTFVLNGELLSKGEAKAGYCSIIDGELSIGIADATPMLEQTLIDGGCFFRQYPLVVGGQIVENKPKGKAIRKALAEMGGDICLVMSKEKLTFHEFSQLLIDAGVRNAIYLVGSTSYGYYVNEEGERILTGNPPTQAIENLSFIIWE